MSKNTHFRNSKLEVSSMNLSLFVPIGPYYIFSWQLAFLNFFCGAQLCRCPCSRFHVPICAHTGKNNLIIYFPRKYYFFYGETAKIMALILLFLVISARTPFIGVIAARYYSVIKWL